MFITLEGIEGSGKTTQIVHIQEFIQSRGYDCILTKEPGGTEIGEKIRGILLDPENKDLVPLTELLLYMADRAQHLKTKIDPLLSIGKVVLCDRYFDATLVYQGFARGVEINLIERLHNLLFEGLKPDVTFLLDLAPGIGLARAWKQIKTGARADLETRFEKETLLFHEKVRKGYLKLADAEPERFKIIDASQDEIHVSSQIIKTLSLYLNLTNNN